MRLTPYDSLTDNNGLRFPESSISSRALSPVSVGAHCRGPSMRSALAHPRPLVGGANQAHPVGSRSDGVLRTSAQWTNLNAIGERTEGRHLDVGHPRERQQVQECAPSAKHAPEALMATRRRQNSPWRVGAPNPLVARVRWSPSHAGVRSTDSLREPERHRFAQPARP